MRCFFAEYNTGQKFKRCIENLLHIETISEHNLNFPLEKMIKALLVEKNRTMNQVN